jgi:pimeloyl-ACP methyl ester carboxylesterase
MLDPWGLGAKPAPLPNTPPPSIGIKLLHHASQHLSPFSVLRALGSNYGQHLVERTRGDIHGGFGEIMDDAKSLVSQYVVAINKHTPGEYVIVSFFVALMFCAASGEDAFRALSVPVAYPRIAMGPRLVALPMPISFIYGDRSWISHRHGAEVCRIRSGRFKDQLSFIQDSSHHIYIENWRQFNAELVALKN